MDGEEGRLPPYVEWNPCTGGSHGRFTGRYRRLRARPGPGERPLLVVVRRDAAVRADLRAQPVPARRHARLRDELLVRVLDAESSLAETAAVLGIHRNTVSARITKIQQLLGVDLTNPNERLALHLACRTARD